MTKAVVIFIAEETPLELKVSQNTYKKMLYAKIEVDWRLYT